MHRCQGSQHAVDLLTIALLLSIHRCALDLVFVTQAALDEAQAQASSSRSAADSELAQANAKQARLQEQLMQQLREPPRSRRPRMRCRSG